MATVAMLVGEGFEDSEFKIPYERLKKSGHKISILGEKGGVTLHGKSGKTPVKTEVAAGESSPDMFDLLVIPGGYGPDHLRVDSDVVNFTREFAESGKPVAAVCHGPQLLIEAGVVKDRTLTSWPSVRTDLINAGAKWVDKPLVEDGNFISSRKPDDLQVFSDAILRRLES